MDVIENALLLAVLRDNQIQIPPEHVTVGFQFLSKPGRKHIYGVDISFFKAEAANMHPSLSGFEINM
jgi:hypothetical protein